jgi:hypothetical protein
MKFYEAVNSVGELAKSGRRGASRLLPAHVGRSEGFAFCRCPIVHIRNFGRINWLSPITASYCMERPNVGFEHGHSEFAISARRMVEVDPKYLQQFVNFPLKVRDVRPCERVLSGGHDPLERLCTFDHFTVGKPKFWWRDAHLKWRLILNACFA